MKNLDIQFVENKENNKYQTILINGKDLYDRSYCYEGNHLTIRDKELLDYLQSYSIEELLEYIERISIYLEDDDLSISLYLNPYYFYFLSEKEILRVSAFLNYSPEDWSKGWTIREHFNLFSKKVNLIDGAEVHCDFDGKDELGEPDYNLLSGFGMGILINDNSVTLESMLAEVKHLCISINEEVEKDFLSSIKGQVVERCIEFSSEYHQAGLGILNYFSTYLAEQYPEENATVKIEQNGLTVRMIIETESGKSETVEKALHEYELIVKGEELPEKFAKSDKLVLELKNELRIAKYRLESNQDIMLVQNNQIDKLLNIVGDGLSKSNQVSIDFKPEISVSTNISINQNISATIGNINELLEELPKENILYENFKELENSLEKIENENDPSVVRKSSAMSKFKRLIDKISDTSSEMNDVINKVESTKEIFQDIASKYNKIAEWCGLPVVPSVLLK